MKNRKGQYDLGKIIEAGLAILFLAIFLPIIGTMLYSISHPQPQVIVNNTAVEEARNLSEKLAVCEANFNELNNSVVTKKDLIDLTSLIRQTNQNVISIYEINYNYIKNYFSLTIILSLALGFTLSFGLLTLLDWTVFKFELAKGFFRVLRRRFSRVSGGEGRDG